MKERIELLTGRIQEVLPLLVTDRWQEANEKLPVVFEELQELVKNAASDERMAEELPELLRCLRCALWCMQVQDSIQLADVFAYELGQVLQNYRQMLA